jgi:hypothetical protein
MLALRDGERVRCLSQRGLDWCDRFTLTVAAVEATVLRRPLPTRFNRRLTTGSHLLGSYPNGCSERLMVWNGVAVETMVDLIRAGLAKAETIKRLDRGRAMKVARLKITEAGRRALRRAETPDVVPSLQRA